MSENTNKSRNRKGYYNKKNNSNEAEQNVNETNDVEYKKSRKRNNAQSRRNDSYKQPNRRNTTKDYKKIKVEETIEDIEKDIARIEKEIDLEIKEIMALKLGL